MADFAHTNAGSRNATIGWEEEVWMMGNFNHGADTARILIADTTELFRRGLRDALVEGGFAIAGEVDRIEDAPFAYQQLCPDIALLAGGDAYTALRTLHDIRAFDPGARVITLVPHEAFATVVPLVQAGAQGVLLRDAPISMVRESLADVRAGGSALDPRLAPALFASVASVPTAIPQANASQLDSRVLALLSRREREVLRALALGYRNKQIGAELGVSVGTVKTHLRHIFRKLHVSDRTGAVLKALDVEVRKAA
jgi:DNA-binding NarL/FixJ family response regulator